jgi:serine/threonine protein kinase
MNEVPSNNALPTKGLLAEADYDYIKEIGRGGYGYVYLFRRKETGEGNEEAYCAGKFVYRHVFGPPDDGPSTEAYERAFRGLQNFQSLGGFSKDLLRILYVRQRHEEGYFCYMMELADDVKTGRQIDPDTYQPRTLKWELQQDGVRRRLPAIRCVEIARSLARGLQVLHENEFIHRDIRPSNIIFVNGVPKLADIDLLAESDVSFTSYIPPNYAAPEGTHSKRADIYSLGKTLYEICTGYPLESFPALPPDIRDWDDHKLVLDINRVIAKACAHDLRKRYQSVGEMQADLKLLEQGKPLGIRKTLTKLACVTGIGLAIISFFWRAIAPHNPTDNSINKQQGTSPLISTEQPVAPTPNHQSLQPSQHDFQAWPAFIASRLASNAVGGYSFVVRYNGRIAASGVGGYARMPWEKSDPALPWTIDKPMWVGDSGVAAAAMMKLWEEKQKGFSLDAPFWPYVENFFPDVDETVRHITIRNLLTHRCSWNGTFDDLEKASVFLAQSPTNAPGKVRYNAGNIFLLGLVLERISGESYTSYVKQRLLAPVGASGMDTKYDPHLAMLGYRAELNQVYGFPFDWESKEAVGGKNWFASASDWSAFISGLADGRILSSDTGRMMFNNFGSWSRVGVDGQTVGYSIGSRWNWHWTARKFTRAGDIKIQAMHFTDGVDAVLLINSNQGDSHRILIEAWKLKY